MRRLNTGTAAAIVVALGCWVSPTHAQETAGRTVGFELAYTLDGFSNLTGGHRAGTRFLDDADLAMTIDAERLLGWPGATLFLYGIGNQGGSPSELIGDLQGVSNIDAPDTWKLFEAWLEQRVWDGRLSLLLGLWDLNGEFDVIENAGLFVNSSHGIGPDFSQTGLNGPSIFPTTSLAFRARVRPSHAFYVQGVVLDATPGDPENPSGTHVHLYGDDGVLLAAELGYLVGGATGSKLGPGKIAVGGYTYTAAFACVHDSQADGSPLMRSGNGGLYVLAEQMVYRESGGPDQGLALFVRTGIANQKVNQLGSYVGAGLVYTGLLPSRDEDRFGVAVASAINGSDFKQAQAERGTPVDDAEIAVEVTYAARLSSVFTVQPDLQYVIAPGTDPAVGNALVVGLRLGVSP